MQYAAKLSCYFSAGKDGDFNIDYWCLTMYWDLCILQRSHCSVKRPLCIHVTHLDLCSVCAYTLCVSQIHAVLSACFKRVCVCWLKHWKCKCNAHYLVCVCFIKQENRKGDFVTWDELLSCCKSAFNVFIVMLMSCVLHLDLFSENKFLQHFVLRIGTACKSVFIRHNLLIWLLMKVINLW